MPGPRLTLVAALRLHGPLCFGQLHHRCLGLGLTLTLPCLIVQVCARQAVVDSVVAQISAVAASGSRLCLDAVPRDMLDGRVKPNRGWINGRDVRPPFKPL